MFLTALDLPIMKVTIIPHDPTWVTQFATGKASLDVILSGIPIHSIEHVGSTSIPGLPAKPVLDIDIIIPASSLPSARAALVTAGYFDCGEMNMPGRFAFRQPVYGAKDAAFGTSENGEMRRNTYLMIEGCVALRNYLDLERMLAVDEGVRREYGTLKTELADKEWNTIGGYSFSKTKMICEILEKAGWSEKDLEEVRICNS
jgi:GrpB-like predicted nucleotidyltransferase (UPF0157 family)